ncbi:hypothetical protein APHAL10511_000901 [Amanita phalloides]|nr:hypothetical protein APHAL10511_000901 [Amanita phalloides]
MNIATIIFAVSLGAYVSVGPAIVLSKVYANSMMVLVNDRRPSPRPQDDAERNTTVTVNLSSLRWASTGGIANSTEERCVVNNETEDNSSAQTAVESRSK